MAITLVASTTINPAGTGGGTSPAIDTTGATLLVVSVSWFFAAGTPVVSDTKGNTWVGLTQHTTSNGNHRFFYVLVPTVGTGHTVTVTGTTIYAVGVVYAFAGAYSYQYESGNGHASTSPVASGSVTPSTDGALILTGLTANDAATDAVSPGFGAVTTVPNVPGVHIQGSAAYQIQATAAAINPTWSWSGGTHSGIAVSSAVFTPAGAAFVAKIGFTTGGAGGTSPAITTTGATLLLVGLSWYSGGGSTATLSDSKGNTYTGLTTHGTTPLQQRLYYVLAPTVGTGHTFTVSGTSGFAPVVFAYALSAAVSSYQTESGAAATATSLASGSVTPSTSGALVVTGLTFGGLSASLTPSGFTVDVGQNRAGVSVGGGLAYQIQATAAAINPTWAFPASTDAVVSTAVFLLLGAASPRADAYVWGPI
jgi:hypothetical protein